ncbi:MAG: S8 family serine peptidase, partial [Dehalococcoidia bacterium]|nr:S8 family serine peptidase [Dehalococcoidia bacterium]
TITLAAGPDFEPGAVLVRWGPGIRTQDATVIALGALTVDSIPALGITKLRVAPGKEQEAIAALKSAGAEIAEPNYLRRIALVPNDPYPGCLSEIATCRWNLNKINAPSAWDITMGSSNIIVAVVDTGMDTSHPDRPQNLIRGADYIADPTGATLVSSDPQGHGTHVSGIVAARTNNGIGVAGVAPGVSLMAVRVLDASGSGDTDTTAKGIIYAVDHGARVINLSLSGFDSSFVEEEAVNYAYSKGVMIVAAAGNCFALGTSGCPTEANPTMYPAALPHVVAVAATDSSDNHAFYSEEGSYVDLAAPGGGSYTDAIWSTCIGSVYCQKAGTSMASPHVAGVAALVWSVNPSLTPDQVESIMRQSAVDLGSAGRDDVFGYGRVDAYQAVVATQSTLNYAAQFAGQSFPASMAGGQTFAASVDVKNTGGATWFQGGPNPVRLGASEPLDRASPFYTAGNWPNASRPAALSQSSVAPGQVGRFAFVLTAPAQGGTFTEHFQVVI